MMRFYPLLVSAAILIAALGIRAEEPALIETVRNAVFDVYQRWRPREIKPVPIQVVDIDEASIEILGQWPWPRDVLADLVNHLNEAGAASIAFDMMFSEADRTSPNQMARRLQASPELKQELDNLPDHDRLFAEALAKGRAVTGLALTNRDKDTSIPVVKFGVAQAGDDPKPFLLDFPGAITSMRLFDEAAKGSGAMNFAPDQDGVVRRVPLLMRNGSKIVPSLIAESLRVAQGASTYIITSSGASAKKNFGDPTGLISVRIGDLTIPTDANGRLWLHFGDLPADMKTPAWKIIRDETTKDTFAGKIVLIGASATGLLDLRFSPLGSMPGVEMQAQMLAQMINGQYLSRPDWANGAEMVFMLVLGLVVMGLTYLFGAVISVLLGMAAVVISIGLSMYAFAAHGLLIDPVFPALTGVLVFLSCSVLRHLQTEQQGRWIREAFSHYVSPNFVDELIRNPDQMELGGERRVLSFLFSDLAGFTPLVEKSEPGTLIPLLNEYLNGMVEIGFRHGGTLDAIVGDATAFFFNAPVTQADHAERAIACALEMDQFAREFSEKYRRLGQPVGKTRIGVHTGPVIIGNMGGDALFNYAAHGDAINTASRMEGVNKYLGTNVCISIETAMLAPDFTGRPVGIVVLKGKTTGIVALEPLTKDELESDRVQRYLDAYDLVLAEDPAALERFRELSTAFPTDPLIQFHLERLETGHKGAMIHMDEK